MNFEDPLQALIVDYVRTVAPDILIYAVPNGAYLAGTVQQRKRQAAKLIWTGMLPGIWDLTLLGRDGFRAAIEVKAGRNTLTDDQDRVRERYISLGIPHCVARSINDVRLAFETWGIATREARPISEANHGRAA